ncbi:hypothetical protein [Cryptosporangium minutisporangium]|uniref:Secreted protein n=1 Tax=Cryptosporangium minutisporangium TaxID=113569 RepID=A0ABP6SSF5_9ACTN
MRKRPSTSTDRLQALSWFSIYVLLAAFVIVLLTTGGLTAAIVGALLVGVLIGSYRLEQWARQHTIYASEPRPAPVKRIPASNTRAAAARAPRASQDEAA